MKLEVKNLTCGYPHKVINENISFAVDSGDIICLLGPNGVGKTTLFKGILGLVDVLSGKVLVDGEDIKGWSNRRLARTLAYVPQAHTPPFAFSVRDVVIMDRNAHLGSFAKPSGEDVKIADETLEKLGITHLRHSIYTEISGGERQMVLIARALAQQPAFLIMDEPTANLDYGNQVRVLSQIKELAASGLGIIMTSHSPDHAFLCSTKVALFLKNRTLLIGSPAEIVTETNLQQAYGVEINIITGRLSNGRDLQLCTPVI